MSEHRLEHLDLCAEWALGTLSADDRRKLDEHLAGGCVECEAALADFSAATVLLAASAPATSPSPRFRERVISAVRASTDAAPRPVAAPPVSGPWRDVTGERRARPAWTTWVPLAAAAALAIATGLLWMQVQKLDGQLRAEQGRLAQSEQKRLEQEKWNEVLNAPEARVSVLAPTTDGDPRLRARATYDPATRRAVVVFENFQKPTARDYQLWVIKDGSPASLGVIQTDADGRAVLRLENVGDSFALSAFAVSLEPEGGSPNPAAPTGPVVMLGKLSS